MTQVIITQLLVAVSPFFVTWLTGLTKNHVLSSTAGVAAVRFVCAVLSLIAAVLTAMAAGGGHFDVDATSLISDVVLTFINFVGATGLYHIGQTTKPQ